MSQHSDMSNVAESTITIQMVCFDFDLKTRSVFIHTWLLIISLVGMVTRSLFGLKVFTRPVGGSIGNALGMGIVYFCVAYINGLLSIAVFKNKKKFASKFVWIAIVVLALALSVLTITMYSCMLNKGVDVCWQKDHYAFIIIVGFFVGMEGLWMYALMVMLSYVFQVEKDSVEDLTIINNNNIAIIITPAIEQQ